MTSVVFRHLLVVLVAVLAVGTLAKETQEAQSGSLLLSGPYVIAVSTNQAAVCWQTRNKTRGVARAIALDVFQKLFPLPERAEGTDDYFVDYGPVRLVALDVYEHVANDALDEWLVKRENWLMERMAEARDRRRIVVVHKPIYSRTVLYTS